MRRTGRLVQYSAVVRIKLAVNLDNSPPEQCSVPIGRATYTSHLCLSRAARQVSGAAP